MPATPVPPDAGRRVARLPLLVAALAGAVAVVLAAFWFAGHGGSSPPSYGSSPAVHGATSPPRKRMAEIDIVNFGFTPSELTVKAGTTIRWTNKGYVPHTVDFTDGAVNSGVLNNGNQFTHTFNAPGTYPYICHIHPFMHGTVVVTPREENRDATLPQP
jgi:amicyanin